MLKVSVEPIANGQKFVNDGFGNRCIICGSYFDECGTCNSGHQQGKTYYCLPEEEKPEPKKAVMATITVTCGVFSGCRCTICGGFFADGDDICANGHKIGKQYPQVS